MEISTATTKARSYARKENPCPKFGRNTHNRTTSANEFAAAGVTTFLLP